MQSLLDILNKTADYFAEKRLENARLNAELLLAHALGCKRMDLYLQFDRPMTDEDLAALRPLVGRRGRREPLQHILGQVDFFNLALKVDARALIPRPETEELLERVTKTLASSPETILDLGTGSGALALALAKHYPDAAVSAVDTSEEALALAAENARNCGLESRVSFKRSSWFENVEGQFDLIVSNPPYLTEKEWQDAQPEVRDHEPKAALVAAEEGLADLRAILGQAPGFLKPGGLLSFETGIAHHTALAQIAETEGYARCESHPDLSNRDRFFLAWQPS